MTWRTVILSNEAKLSLRMNNLVVTNEQVVTIPLVELGVLIIENPNIVITVHLLNALAANKTTVVLCDQKHMPSTVVHSVYGHHRQSKQILNQMNWTEERKGILWQAIMQQKILNQSKVLTAVNKPGAEELKQFSQEVTLHDQTNREGHAAKVYFNRLFGNEFTRREESTENAGLNYGYAIIHALIVRTIVSKGYLSEVGIHHVNEYNQYNLASDLIEVFRPLIDYTVVTSLNGPFDKQQRRALLNIINQKIFIRNGEYFLPQVIQIYIDQCIQFLNQGDEENLLFPHLVFKKSPL